MYPMPRIQHLHPHLGEVRLRRRDILPVDVLAVLAFEE
jgi:hypothetical protein